MRSALYSVGVLLALAAVAPRPAEAQWIQYLAPGTLGEERKVSERELARAVSEARWTFAGVPLQPWLGISSATYTDNVFATPAPKTSDTTASLGVGLRAFLPAGEDVLLSAYVQPEYVWWQDLDDQRRRNDRFGAALFGFFDRLDLRVQARRDEVQRIATPEVDVEIHQRREQADLDVEVKLSQRLELFGTTRLLRLRHLDDEDFHPAFRGFSVLDRDETVLRGGIRLALGAAWRLGFGGRHSEAEFMPEGRNLSNRGSSPLFQLQFRGRALSLDGEWVRNSVDPAAGSDFPTYDTLTGHGLLTWQSHPHRAYQLYASRQLVYSLDEAFPYFEDRRVGAALLVEVGRQARLKLFFEDGRHAYIPFDPATADRSDDTRSFGGRVTAETLPGRHWVLSVEHTRIDSEIAAFDRSTLRIRAGVTFGGPTLPW